MNQQLSRPLRAVLAVLVGLGAAAGLARPAAAAPGRDEIFGLLEVDRVPADYVILVDTSGSMTTNNLYGNVKSTLRTFVAGLTRTDHVAVYTFDNTPTARYIGRGGDPDRIIGALPDTPSQNSTDIGAALAKSLDELERADASPVASVVLITDGAHEPPAGSLYPVSTDAPSWKALTDRAGKLKAGSVHGYALPLTRTATTGAALLGLVFKSTDTLDPNQIADMGEYLDRSKQRTRVEKARLALAGDVGKGVTATWTAPAGADLGSGDAAVKLTLRSDAAKMPLTVTGLAVRADGGPTLTGDVPDRVDLRPGESKSFDLRLHWAPGAGPVPYHRERSATATLSLQGAVASDWAAPLAPDIALNVPAAPAVQPARVEATASVGTWIVQGVAAGLVLVLLVVLGVLFATRRPRQSGTLLALDTTTGLEQARFELSGRKSRLEGRGLQGEAEVIAKRVPRGFANREGLEYVIKYRRAEHTQVSSLPSRGTVLINGVNFEHVMDERAR
ncbi:vWA domain-containing protein [Dactylosporangium sp. NPDC051485]|uniref:vWA domain-containing protein n=1 Tax=Dactylosporangium sp. NPDC051485 TaxID=3154846 RepID=UPI00343DDFDF